MTASGATASTPRSAESTAQLPEPLTSDPEQRVVVSIISRLAALRTADRAHPKVRLWGTPALCALFGVPSLLNPANGSDVLAQIAVMVGFTVPLLWRERRPVLVFALTTAVSLVALPLGILNGADAARVVALYNVGRLCVPRQIVIAVGVTVAQLAAWSAVFYTGGQLRYVTRPEVVTVLAMVTVAAFAGLGLAARLANSYITALEVERDQRARLATAQERDRVSREMHDILGHTLAVIVGLADGGAALTATQPQRGAEALRIIGGSGRDALAELRRLLTAVGGDDLPRGEAPLAPQPGLADLEALLERFRAAGPAAAFHTRGDLAGLSQGLQLTVYRIIQEALTNTLKHAASDTTVTVTLTADTGAVHVTVEDTGPRLARGNGRPGSRKGLVGMRERAALYEGEVTSGPNSHGGWTVHARLVPTVPTTHPEGHPA
ncbi:sensor histidine kinase [Streptomyces shenzhenensis]|uniref:histidine kinase n=1 Tax=Streptomyces shenzhenensis TaxID=943815 RepID=A0A3M0ID49_9ACTN|nr:histidine kinase [Streptomyces shenzhenensis]RMB79756.1 two-component sensor histidine kinase [Streptomyces shenzhenensis]